MGVDQLNAKKKDVDKNIRFKNTFLNYFLQDRFYLDEKTPEKELSNRKIT